MRKLFSALSNPTFITLVGIILLALVIWLIGPIIAVGEYKPLASVHVRMLTIVVIFLGWGLNNLRHKHADKKAADSLNSELLKDSDSPAPTSAQSGEQAESEIINDRLQSALKRLQDNQKGFGRQKLYQLPWYVIVGAPGSGKTTALQQSGLNFPLDNEIQAGSIPGSGGTRYCDWWFSDQAILIDTAGRYTTQDTPNKTESRAWLSFLGRLKKTRPKRPLNGVIVTISVDELVGKTATQRRLHATAIKHRIQELNNHLSMTLPIYVLITKADRIGGFNAFFNPLSEDARQEPWGITFKEGLLTSGAHQSDNHMRLRQFDQAFDNLVAQLNTRVVSCLNREVHQHNRELIFQFPSQVHALKDRLDDFLAILFTPNQFEEPIHWRGIYLVSATQSAEQSRWIGSILPSDQIQGPTEPQGPEPKNYFLPQLFTKIIFAEAAIAQLNRSARNRMRWITLGAFSGVTLCFLAAIASWKYSHYANLDTIEAIESGIAAYKEHTHGGLSTTTDWTTLAKGLSQLQALPTGYTQGTDQDSIFQGFGLYQGEKLGAQTRNTYLQALTAFYQVKLTEMLLQEIDAAGHDDEYLYESLKHYLMLFHPKEMNHESFKTWVQILWRKNLPPQNRAQVVESLLAHLNVVLSHNLSPPPIDTLRVARSRHLLNETPLDLRIYRRIKDAWAREQEHFSVASVLGPRAQNYFERASDDRLDAGVPALFTYRGFHTGYMIERKFLAKQLSAEQWIYGQRQGRLSPKSVGNASGQNTVQSRPQSVDSAVTANTADTETSDAETLSMTSSELAKLAETVDAHYFKDYIAHWERYLNDLRLKQFSDLESGWKLARGLAGSDQPLNTFLLAVRKNLALDTLPKADPQALEKAAEATGSNVLDQAARLQRLVPEANIALPGAQISKHFADWIDYTDPNTNEALAQLEQVFLQLNNTLSEVVTAEDVNLASFQLMSTKGFNQGRRLQRILASAPPGLQGWFNTLGQASRNVLASSARLHINARWKDEILPFYNEHIAGRYPVDNQSTEDLSRKDFTDFFGPQGTLINFYNTYIQPFVQEQGDRLAWRSGIGLRNASLTSFEQLFDIQKAYFAGDEGTLSLAFYLTPHSLDKSVVAITIDFGDAKYRYAHGPIRTERFQWPQGKHEQTTLTLALAGRGTPITIIKSGEWNWFRLLDTAQMSTEGDQVKLYFKFNTLETEHYLRPVSGHNPFKERLVDTFKLPPIL